MTKVLVTGSAGFIGSHLAHHFLDEGATVIGIDNLSRIGGEFNLNTLKKRKNFIFQKIDVRSFDAIKDVFKQHRDLDLVIHQAAQVAVTTSVKDPRLDFETNALGTFNVLEATRLYAPEAFFEFASTNKVYGKMEDIEVVERHGRYEYGALPKGVSEDHCLDFHSPYGCSKGVADQYVHDYNRIYGLRTVVLRQSCIYGPRQFGVEDQGWVAWFAIASLLNRQVTIYGDGKQGRDLLWIDDLVNAYVKLYENADDVAGEIFNVGGGPNNVLSLLELVDLLKEDGVLGEMPVFAEWRPGDQKIFVSNIEKISKAVQWEPSVSPREGVGNLGWIDAHPRPHHCVYDFRALDFAPDLRAVFVHRHAVCRDALNELVEAQAGVPCDHGNRIADLVVGGAEFGSLDDRGDDLSLDEPLQRLGADHRDL